jgi:hypothetical protein
MLVDGKVSPFLEAMVLAPAERADVVVHFGKFARGTRAPQR